MQSAQGFDQQTIGLRHYWRRVRKRSWLIIAMMFVSLTLGALYIARTQPVYQATAKLLIELENLKVTPVEGIVGSGSTEAHYQIQYELLRSRFLVRHVIDALDLRNHPEFAPHKSKEGLPTRERLHPSGPEISGALTTTREPQGAATSTPDIALVDAFLSRLTVRSNPNSHLVNVSFKAHDPLLAAEAINTLVRLHIDFNLKQRFAGLHDALELLNTQNSSMHQRVEASDLALQHYKDEHDLHLLDDRLSSVKQEISEINASLIKAETERIELETLYSETQRAAQKGQTVEWMPEVVANTLIQELKGKHADLLHKFAQLSQQYDAKHPSILQIQAQLDTLQAKIDTEVKKIVQAFYARYQLARTRERALLARMEALKREVQVLNKGAIEYNVLKRDAESNKRLYELLLTRLKEANLSTNPTNGNTIRLIDPAEVPQEPINTRPVWILITAGVIGLIPGVSLATFIDYFDNTLKTPDEAEKLLGFPVVGAIEQFGHGYNTNSHWKHLKVHRDISLIAWGDSTHHDIVATVKLPGFRSIATQTPKRHKISSEAQALEAFRRLQANLLFNHTEQPRKVFLVTSPHPKDGKTTIAANLAVIMAHMERRVLLVEADLRNPSNTLMELFPVSTDCGLSELLLTEKYEDTIGAFGWNPLLVPAGERLPNSFELLGSKRMQRFIEFAREHYDVVIIDSPPLLAVSDAMVLSPLVDSILMVLRAGSTSHDHARHSIAQLLGLQTPSPTTGDEQKVSGNNTHLGLVINFLDPRKSDPYNYSVYHRQ